LKFKVLLTEDGKPCVFWTERFFDNTASFAGVITQVVVNKQWQTGRMKQTVCSAPICSSAGLYITNFTWPKWPGF